MTTPEAPTADALVSGVASLVIRIAVAVSADGLATLAAPGPVTVGVAELSSEALLRTEPAGCDRTGDAAIALLLVMLAKLVCVTTAEPLKTDPLATGAAPLATTTAAAVSADGLVRPADPE